METVKDQKNGTMLKRQPDFPLTKMNSIRKWNKEISCQIWTVKTENQQDILWESPLKWANQTLWLNGGLMEMDKGLKNGTMLRKLLASALTKTNSTKTWSKETSYQIWMDKMPNQPDIQWESQLK